jgi:hypothetical protein
LSQDTTKSDVDQHGPGPQPLCSKEAFPAFLTALVADEAPRLFAIVIEHGDRADIDIAAWGMAFDDNTQVITTDRRQRFNLTNPVNALRHFRTDPNTTPHLIWFDPTATTDPNP